MSETVTIVKIKGKGAGAETITEIPKATWDKWQKEYLEGSYKEAGDWKQINKDGFKPITVEVPKVKTEAEIMAEVEAKLTSETPNPNIVEDKKETKKTKKD